MSDPNLLINVVINWIKTHPIVWTIPAIILAIFIWYKGTQIWNGIGNFVFATKMSWQGRKVESELESAAQQKLEIDKTLIELAKSKEALAAAQKEREIRERIFNDANKTAKEKVAAYEAAMSAAPVRTDPTGVSLSDLCTRARAIGASAATIESLCQ